MYVLDFPSEKSLLCKPVFWFMFPVMDYFSFVVIVLVVFGFCFLVSILLLACNSPFCIYCSFTLRFLIVCSAPVIFSPCLYYGLISGFMSRSHCVGVFLISLLRLFFSCV